MKASLVLALGLFGVLGCSTSPDKAQNHVVKAPGGGSLGTATNPFRESSVHGLERSP
jgi:hypothetical protein